MTYDLTTLPGRLRAIADGCKLTADGMAGVRTKWMALNGRWLTSDASVSCTLDALSNPGFTNWRIYTEPKRDMATDPRRGDVVAEATVARTVLAVPKNLKGKPVVVVGILDGGAWVLQHDLWAALIADGTYTPVNWAEDADA